MPQSYIWYVWQLVSDALCYGQTSASTRCDAQYP
jgi:hypothetical protein